MYGAWIEQRAGETEAWPKGSPPDGFASGWSRSQERAYRQPSTAALHLATLPLPARADSRSREDFSRRARERGRTPTLVNFLDADAVDAAPRQLAEARSPSEALMLSALSAFAFVENDRLRCRSRRGPSALRGDSRSQGGSKRRRNSEPGARTLSTRRATSLSRHRVRERLATLGVALA